MMSKGLGGLEAHHRAASNFNLKNSPYKVREAGEGRIIGKAATHGWEFSSNPDHLKAHINAVKYGRSQSQPKHMLAVAEPSNEYMTKYQVLHEIGT